ncbi:hypothetical protein HHK36_031220 [Tetracentron sinense]|uniref:Uncharacterized protein n=1 Tax=Tetracentron sinense TaxID=13715 RepID=A0A834YEF4_TETSI|nr:hypothetical protein HHK36_031220 [Tetracentron sinense]
MDFKDQRPQLKLDKMKGRQKNMKSTTLCIPKLRRNNSTSNNNNLSPISLLERFREAVFRLIMVSALSKATHQSGPINVAPAYYPPDPHHSEAVADCIDFIKKSAVADETRNPHSSVDAAELCYGL